MGFTCGIVGLPNVGKSTIFNALTSSSSAEAANYPFCTIEPNQGRVFVPDERVEKLSQLNQSKQKFPTTLDFSDIAGLVKGASKGEGLGNQFLSHIRQVDAIIHVLRCFDDKNITHVNNNINPLNDLEIVETELMLSDLDMLDRRLVSNKKKLNINTKENKLLIQAIENSIDLLKKGKLVSKANFTDEEFDEIRKLDLITSKPIIYICNVDEKSVNNGNKYSEAVNQYSDNNNRETIIISAEIESQVSQIKDFEEKQLFFEELNITETGLSRIIKSGYSLLDLITFFTSGEKETRAWNIKNGTIASKAAGKIHTDFERGFIRAETISYSDYINCNGELEAKNQGKMRSEGKDYIVQDGDIINFRFNV
tara:strand:+ start:172 stop:1272 length:1101 start_codon:yes stop_codon:yes gene_type:complete